MKMRLRSDFLDYYDHHFDLTGIVFRRLSTDGMPRGEMLQFLKRSGENPPRFGPPLELDKSGVGEVVVYLDERAHRAEKKIKVPVQEAIRLYPRHLCSEYISGNRAASIRRLQVGSRCFWLRYQSEDEWRSNAGDVHITILGHETGYHSAIRLPLFAIDYVEAEGKRFGIDFNVAPQIRGTGLEAILEPKQVVQLIKEAYFDICPESERKVEVNG